MAMSTLVALFMLLQMLFCTLPALAKDTSEAATPSKKHAAKKSTVFKRKEKSAVSAKQPSVTKKSIKVASNSPEKLTKKSITVTLRGKRKVIYAPGMPVTTIQRTPRVLSAREQAGLNLTNDALDLQSNAVLVLDPSNSEVLFSKNSNAVLPIASITKLMTALVVVESQQDMAEVLAVTEADIDRLKNTSSRLRIGSKLTRANMLHIALMSSENRAASALGRHYPGGVNAFVAAMNAKAKALSMTDTHYVEPTGLSSSNVSSARDLAKLTMEAQQYPLIRAYSTNREYAVNPGGSVLQYKNSNPLVTNPEWEIGLQKTGYIVEAGRCLVMQAMIEGRSVVMVFLDGKGQLSRSSDAGRIRKWLQTVKKPAMLQTAGNVDLNP